MELLSLVYSYSDTETIQAIMEEVPGSWAFIINPQYHKTIREFQNTVKYHKESLEKLEPLVSQPSRLPNQEYSNSWFPYCKAHVNLVSWSQNIRTPQFPKDDKNVSPCRTPELIGARPCRHCRSGNHWDNECRHSRKGEKLARVNYIQLEDNNIRAQEDYFNLFYQLDSDAEQESSPQDFCRPLKRSDFPDQLNNPNSEKLEDVSYLEGTEGCNKPLGLENTQSMEFSLSDAISHSTLPKSSLLSKNLSSTPKIPLNRNTRRWLARDIVKVHHLVPKDPSNPKPLIELKKHLARPPGCSFLGSQATQVPATMNFLDQNLMKVIVDSRSDITLISEKSLVEMQTLVKIRQGQRVNLVQVTGNASISGYINIDLYFHTPEGPVKNKCGSLCSQRHEHSIYFRKWFHRSILHFGNQAGGIMLHRIWRLRSKDASKQLHFTPVHWWRRTCLQTLCFKIINQNYSLKESKIQAKDKVQGKWQIYDLLLKS